MRKSIFSICVLGLVASLGTTSAAARGPSCSDCGNDSECPGDKVCENGCCVDRGHHTEEQPWLEGIAGKHDGTCDRQDESSS